MTSVAAPLASASRRDSRVRNLGTALQLIYRGNEVSRADIARMTGLTRATVSNLVAHLIDEGLVREVGTGEASAGGKPPTLLAVVEGSREIVAVDLAGTPFRGAVMDLAGTVLHRAEAVPAGGDAVETVVDLVSRLAARASAPLLGVGVGTPGVVAADGTVVEAANLGWHGLPLARLLEEAVGLPVDVTNDAQAAALGEFRLHRSDDLLLVAVGEGIGAGLVLEGRLRTGARRTAGEIGHVVVEPGGDPCRCGNRGCLETLAAVPALVRRAGGANDLAPVIEQAAEHLASVLAPLVAALDLSRLVIACRTVALGEPLTAAVARSLERRLLAPISAHLRVEESRLGGDLVLGGAAAVVLAARLGVVLR